MNLDNFRSSQVVDLSVTIAEDLPASWPAHMPFASKIWNYFEPTESVGGVIPSFAPYQTRFMVLDEHCGTHFDGPTHFIPPQTSQLPWAGQKGEETGDRVPLKELMGTGVCLDMRHLRRGEDCQGQSPWISTDDIKQWESSHGEIAPGTVVLFRTGWDEFYAPSPIGQQYVHEPLVQRSGEAWPAPNVDAMLYLYEKGVLCVGTDAPSMGASHDGAPVHREGLSRGMRFIEVLTGLDQLPNRDFLFIFLPIKVKGATGGPGRAIAILPGA